MEIQKPKHTRRKDRSRKKSTALDTEIPDTSAQDEFDIPSSSSDCTEIVSTSYSCSQIASNIENELLDAVKDVRNSDVEDHDVDSIESLSDRIEFSNSETCDNLEWSASDHSVSNMPVSVDTEMKEIHSNTFLVNGCVELEADTRLESPRRFINDSAKSKVELNVEKDSTASVKDKVSNDELEEKTITPKEQSEAAHVNKKSQESTRTVLADCKVKEVVVDEIKPFSEAQLWSLYSNGELERSEEFVREFVEHHLSGGYQNHRLYELLVNYLRARTRLTADAATLQGLQKDCRNHQGVLWTIERTVVTESGECQDGNPVSASHEHKVSHFDERACAALAGSLGSVRDLVNETHSLDSYTAEVLRLRLEQYVHDVCAGCSPRAPGDLAARTQELRACVSVLFCFQRRHVRDEQFVGDTRAWLLGLVAVLLGLASWKDHLYVLNHVLRCPAGVASWAAGLVQVPAPPPLSQQHGASVFADHRLGHMLAVLATLLMPVREREKFLQQVHMGTQDSDDDSFWVLVDSDGEEDEETSKSGCTLLKENDLVAILNQIPIDSLFRHVLLVDRRDDRDVYDDGLVTESHVLRLFAFASVLVRVLGRGLQTYGIPRYRQFAKRLGRLIRHAVQYVSDQWLSLRNSGHVVDGAMLRRLQVEYDAFLLRATQGIFSSQRLGAWQFLAVIPYNLVSINALWRLFYTLHKDGAEKECLPDDAAPDTGWEELVWSCELRQQFEEKLAAMPEAESFYLLTTFANMALARGNADEDFIRVVTLDLFQTGFLSSATQESCSKSARMLLVSITTRHPHLLSDILGKLKENIQLAGKLSLYLFRELPLRLWVPRDQDLDTLSAWLLESPLASTESGLARLVLASLDWGCDGHRLVLPLRLHRRVALLVVRAALQFVPDTSGNALFSEGVKQVSSYATSMLYAQSSEQVFSAWAWEMISRLRLHVLDQPDHVVWTTMASPSEAMRDVPDMDSSSELEVLAEGVRNKQPIACYAAVLMSTWGHSIPLICTKGLNQLQLLLCFYKYDAVLGVLHRIVPLFLCCEESLLGCDRFLSVLISLLTADKTYMKMAKSLIVQEFPGAVLLRLGQLVESHCANHRKYSLPDPGAFVRLWMAAVTMVPEWTRESSVVYLLDVLFRAAFFHPSVKEMVLLQLTKIHQSTAGPRHGSSLSTLMSWVALGSGQTPTLLPRASSPECPWFACHVLEVEQALQERSGLWPALLRELAASSGKPSVDQSLKKASQAAKVPCPPSASLSIYRWAHQALDTPLDHPLLPLVWQRFFALYLARVPSSSGVDKGGVGDKFFDGMINLSFHKKLKKRLQDATEHFQARSRAGEEQADGQEVVEGKVEQQVSGKDFWEKCCRLMRTFSLWLEEPRLHEPNLFLPALPPQYDSSKLAAILRGDKAPWLEYLDRGKVRESQQRSVHEWEVAHFRTRIHDAQGVPPVDPEEGEDPRQRILKRLQSYDCPVQPPPVRSLKPVVPPIPRDMLLNKGAVLDLLKPCFKSLLEYAQIYSIRVSEHLALDCSFLELLPQLYRDVEFEVVLHAACDSEPHGAARRPSTITCAGPAAIRLKVCEATVNEGTEHLMQQNRAEYETLLQRAMQAPPQKVCAGSVVVEHLITLLEAELESSRSSDSRNVVRKLHEVGVTLFYHIVSLYTEEPAFYPATKQLLTTCIERLGQVFVSGQEGECLRLLATVTQQPSLAGLLGPHFTPTVAGTITFLQLYALVVDTACQKALPELCFVLLSKFDVARWLILRRPRLSERSQFIELVGKALSFAGVSPDDRYLMLYEVYRKHLRLILLHDFPEHYGEVLNLMLKASENQSFSIDIWFDMLNTLIAGKEPIQRRFRPGLNVGKVKEEIRKYATEQVLLAHDELRETVTLLASHFLKERLQYGLYGLYPKYRLYIEPLTIFLGMMGHALVVSTLQRDSGSLSDKLCEQLWPSLSNMFSPWVAPYLTKNLKEPTAAWIQQLADDRSVLLPWIIADGPHAHRAFAMFTECIRFIVDTLPACSNILCFVWQYYVSCYAYPSVKDYVLNVVHANLLSLPWDRFWPSIQDIECMLKVVDQYLPDCHAFLGSVFIEVPWWTWVGHVLTAHPATVTARTHVCLLHLLVKLANEPSVRQSPKITVLLLEAQKFAWHLVDAASYDQVVNWCVMSCDPRVILTLDEDTGPVDVYTLQLLQVVAAYTPSVTNFHQTTLRKRQVFVRACVKLIVSCASRYKALLSKKELAFQAAVRKLLDDVEIVVTASVPAQQQAAEAGLLLAEVMAAVNQPAGSAVSLLAVGCCAKWLGSRDCSSVAVRGVLRVAPTTVAHPDHLGCLLETALTSFFKHTVSQGQAPEWRHVSAVYQACLPQQPPVEDSFVAHGHVLSLYAQLLKRLPSCRDIGEEGSVLVTLVDWLEAIKPTESTEAKLPLLWGKILTLCFRQYEYSGSAELASRSLNRLMQYLLILAEDKAIGPWGILGAIGLRKQSPVSRRCRMLCRAMAAYILAQFQESDDIKIRTTPNAPEAVSYTPSDNRGELASLLTHPEVHKALAAMEALTATKQYQEFKSFVEAATQCVVDPNNSLHNATEVLGALCSQLYQQQYLLVLKA
ncbi:ectopic P granules protein 5 homolog [Bacillus rossius redtenbacheri]|uniref:ectopic P granules protein 5 homolog n=1 Tax=Bacillus rossius redtenbacheri TaxID=93214 RepID=UPI002FDD588C